MVNRGRTQFATSWNLKSERFQQWPSIFESEIITKADSQGYSLRSLQLLLILQILKVISPCPTSKDQIAKIKVSPPTEKPVKITYIC